MCLVTKSEHPMSERIFNRILNNTANETEKLEFFQSLENNPEEREEFYRLKNLRVVSGLNPDRYSRLKDENFQKFWNQVNTAQPLLTLKLWMRYAAIVVVASSLGFFANRLAKNEKPLVAENHIEYSSEKGSVSSVRLDDGSTIWLSSGTKLAIDKRNDGKTIARLNGEAYFDLIPNPKRNFVVDLGKFQIRDIGTTFNIRAYESEEKISTTLISGQIDFIKDSGNPFLVVKPGEYVEYDKNNNRMEVNQHDTSEITAWKDGKFVFIDESLGEICKELEMWYNIEIEIEDQALANIKYTSVVKRSTTVEMVLKYMSVTDQIKYEITNKKEGKDIIKIRK
jgi:ferric-dicitrate binding protein FerR (iron transport regulator)